MTSSARVRFGDLLPCERLGSEASIHAIAEPSRRRRSDRNKFVIGTGPRFKNARAGASLKGRNIYSATLAVCGSWKDDNDESC